jgi:hypothetical protein
LSADPNGTLSVGEYLAGLAWLLAIVGPLLVATVIVVRRRLGYLPLATRLLAGGVIVYGLVVFVHLLPGALSVLYRPVVVGVSLVVLTAAALIPARTEQPEPDPDEPPTGLLSQAIAWLSLAALAALVLGSISGRVLLPITATDVGTFDLPLAASWMQSHSIWGAYEFTPDTFHGAYPHNGVIAALLTPILPFESDFGARLTNYLAFPFVGLGVFCLARELGAARTTAITFAAAGAALPVITRATFDLAMPDVIFYPAFLAGCLFLLREARSSRRTDLALAALGLGLAFGTKWYGVTTVAVVVVVWTAGSLLAGRGAGLVARRLVALGALILAVGGFWLVRNLVEFDNPVFPVEVAPFGITIFDAPPDPLTEVAGDSIADRVTEPEEFREVLFPALRRALGLGGLMLALAMAAIAIVAIVRARRAELSARAARQAGVAVAGLGVLLAYGLTPYTAGPDQTTVLAEINSRYGIPGMLVGAAVVAAAISPRPRLRTAAELLAAVALIDGLLLGSEPTVERAVAGAVAVVYAAAVGALAWGWIRELGRPPRIAVAAASGTALAAVAIAGFAVQDRFAENRVTEADPTFRWALENAPEGMKIGVAGDWLRAGRDPPPVLPMLGPELDNEVDYVGPREDGHLRRYETAGEFRRALEAGGYDLLIVGLADLESNVERDYPTRLGLEPVARSDGFALFDLRTTTLAES